MKPHHRRLFESLTTPLRERPDKGTDPGFVELLNQWISQDPGDFDALYRDHLDSICRIIDVRRKFPVELGAGNGGFKVGDQLDDWTAAALVAVFLAHASSPRAERGGRFKCANTALKLIDLTPHLPERNQVLAWAYECVERLLAERLSG